MKKLLPTLVFALFSALTAGPGIVSVAAAAEEQPSSAPLFAATLSDLDDKPIALERYKGKPLVVNFWARWCGPCRAEMPVLAAAQQREPGVRFLFVNQGEPASAVQAYLQREGLPLHDVWLDPASAFGPAVGSRGLPTTLYLDAQGRRVSSHFGPLNAASLQVALQALRRP